ncbi:ferrous iron transport protein B [Wansuia hejianensis]|uniref:ferrous iron transport protein B n=1 Tax=Wansuia hejianensis TaxID=2763667 RepID=UPI002FE6EF8F
MDILEKELQIKKTSPEDKIIALAGNPNVGKSTVFNNLTGLKQHTGNWPGKTVTNAHGNYIYKDKNYILVDLPGTYSLMANSIEEEVARDFICFGNPNATVVVVDATCLERNLNLVLQTIEMTSNVVVCVNLMDEAHKKGISINLERLSNCLGVPVVGTTALKNKGLDTLMESVHELAYNKVVPKPISIIYDDTIEKAIDIVKSALSPILPHNMNSRWVAIKLLDGENTLLNSINKYLGFDLYKDLKLMDKLSQAKELLRKEGIDSLTFRDRTITHLVTMAEDISRDVISFEHGNYNNFDRKLDKYITSKKFGIPLMVLLLGIVFWITITGANYPSEMLATGLFWIQDRLTDFFIKIGAPSWVHGVLVSGIYGTLAWVVSVMLPPMAIFFPMFTFLEDLGYLPRVAFNLDNYFKKSSACGKQALTMCMGFGCNAAGVIGCRIIDSPRERLIAIITNSFVPCNGRFPILIAVITMFFTGYFTGPFQSFMSTLVLTGVIVLSVMMTLFISKVLSKTILKGMPSTFTLELPPYRKPQLGKVIVHSIFDRTLFVLGRAVVVAAPAGLVIWIMANINIGNTSILSHCANFFDPFAKLIGMDGYIIMAFILGFPANEIVIPILIMSYMATGSMLELDSLNQLKSLLIDNGWTWVTAISVMLFTLFHWPCATTCLTIRKETQSKKWTLISLFAPTIVGIVVCFIFVSTIKIIGLV